MISLLKGLHTAERIEYEQDLVEAISLLIEGIALHAVRVEDDHYADFRNTISALSRRLQDASGKSREIQTISCEALQAMGVYNRELERRQAAADHELRSVISMLTETVGYACRGQERVTAGLRGLENDMARAAEADDLRVLKNSLHTCLASVRTEIDRQDSEYREMRELAERITRTSPATYPQTASTDPVTRLPDRRAARFALNAIFESPTGAPYGICLRLDRLPGINSSCGYEAGNEYLVLVSRFIAQSLQLRGNLYRWSGPGFLIIAQDKLSADQLQRGIERLNAMREGHVLTAGSRSISVGITISSAKVSIRQWADIESFMDHVDAFVSASAPQSQGVEA